VPYIVAMATTMQISHDLLSQLKSRKVYDKESYEEVIWDLLEDTLELSEETKRHLQQSEKDVKEGRTIPLAQIKKELGL